MMGDEGTIFCWFMKTTPLIVLHQLLDICQVLNAVTFKMLHIHLPTIPCSHYCPSDFTKVSLGMFVATV